MHGNLSMGIVMGCQVQLDLLSRYVTLIYPINAQDGINEQEGIFSKVINRSGWNKRAGRANFEAIINKQGGKDQKHKRKP